jgi:hydroxymethylbilane synthase
MEDEIAERFDIRRFVPAPGQAALALQTRCGDARTRALVAGLIDEPTTLATQAELAFLRMMTDAGHSAAAAHARVTEHDTINLMCRVLTPGGRDLTDVTVSGSSIVQIAREAFERLTVCEALV